MADLECESWHCSQEGFAVAPRPEYDNDVLCLSCLWERQGLVSLTSSSPGELIDELPEFTDWSQS